MRSTPDNDRPDTDRRKASRRRGAPTNGVLRLQGHERRQGHDRRISDTGRQSNGQSGDGASSGMRIKTASKSTSPSDTAIAQSMIDALTDILRYEEAQQRRRAS